MSLSHKGVNGLGHSLHYVVGLADVLGLHQAVRLFYPLDAKLVILDHSPAR